MPFSDFGLIQLGSFMKGDGPSSPQYVEFGAAGSAFVGSANYNGSGFYRSPISWNWVGTRVSGTATLNTTEAVGSNIQEVGVGVNPTVGSDLYVRDLSAIGDKTNAFTVDVGFELRFSRP